MPDPQAWNGWEASHVSKVKSSQAVSRDAGNFGRCKATSQPQQGMMYGTNYLILVHLTTAWYGFFWLPHDLLSSKHFVSSCHRLISSICVSFSFKIHAMLDWANPPPEISGGVLTEGTQLAPESGRAQWKFQTDPGLPVSHGLASTGRCPETGWLPNHPQPSATTHNKWWIFVNQESSKIS